MALISKEKSRIYRAKMAANGVKELRGIEAPKSMDKPTERELKGRIALLVKQFLKGKGDI